MKKNLEKFGKILKELRIKKELSLREVCKLADYDPSNWSKIERGKISPPSEEKILRRWAAILGLSRNVEKLQEFIYKAKIAQGIIPQDILSNKNVVKYLPAFFRTLRNKKPTKDEIDQLIELIRNA
jgi:transcriptional regulator with XRE-family HTH domain